MNCIIVSYYQKYKEDRREFVKNCNYSIKKWSFESIVWIHEPGELIPKVKEKLDTRKCRQSFLAQKSCKIERVNKIKLLIITKCVLVIFMKYSFTPYKLVNFYCVPSPILFVHSSYIVHCNYYSIFYYFNIILHIINCFTIISATIENLLSYSLSKLWFTSISHNHCCICWKYSHFLLHLAHL